ncbi:hypothetical protein ACFL1U_01515 [Patescibacteria group bacterium]
MPIKPIRGWFGFLPLPNGNSITFPLKPKAAEALLEVLKRHSLPFDVRRSVGPPKI